MPGVEVAYWSRIVAVDVGDMGFPKPGDLAVFNILDAVSPLHRHMG